MSRLSKLRHATNRVAAALFICFLGESSGGLAV